MRMPPVGALPCAPGKRAELISVVLGLRPATSTRVLETAWLFFFFPAAGNQKAGRPEFRVLFGGRVAVFVAEQAGLSAQVFLGCNRGAFTPARLPTLTNPTPRASYAASSLYRVAPGQGAQ